MGAVLQFPIVSHMVPEGLLALLALLAPLAQMALQSVEGLEVSRDLVPLVATVPMPAVVP